jgi:hypothetical protein
MFDLRRRAWNFTQRNPRDPPLQNLLRGFVIWNEV